MSPLTKKKTRTGDRRLPESWLGLLRDFYPLYPIHTGKDYTRALESADRLIGRKLTSLQSRYVESLTLLIEEYESAHYAIDESWTPLEALKFLIAENDMNASDLGKILGDRSLGSTILNGRRSLSKNHIRILAQHFSVSPALFL